MEPKLKKLIVIEGMVEAEIIKSKLTGFDIPCVLNFESAGRLYGITIDGLGEIRIMVNAEDYEKAKEIIDMKQEEK